MVESADTPVDSFATNLPSPGPEVEGYRQGPAGASQCRFEPCSHHRSDRAVLASPSRRPSLPFPVVGAFDKTPSSLASGAAAPGKAVPMRAWYMAFCQTPLRCCEAAQSAGVAGIDSQFA